MTTKPQPEPHLDADQLNAFAEGALSASERRLCLQHLAECAHCREIAFLAGALLPLQEPASTSVRRFSLAWWPVLSLGAATLAAVIIMVVLLHHAHQTTSPPAVQIATESPTSPSPPAVTSAPMDRARAEPRAQPAPKPYPALKATPKPEPQILDRQQVNGVIASGSTAASAQVTGAAPQQRAAAGGTVPAAPAAAAPPLSQPSQAQAPAVAKAAPAYTLRTYDKLSSLPSRDASGQIAGTITDNSGAAVGHAKVTLDQTSGTALRETLTDAAGRFTISSLPPGKYRLEISSPGFTAQVREVDLGTNQLARVDSQLAVGAASETVTVQAGAPLLNTESASVESLLPGKELPRSSVSSGTRTLALDNAGKLFLSKKAGRHWKAVRGPWKKSTVTNLSLTPDQLFKVTTADGSWLSVDGEHWHSAN